MRLFFILLFPRFGGPRLPVAEIGWPLAEHRARETLVLRA
jgi:hypothetical protein